MKKSLMLTLLSCLILLSYGVKADDRKLTYPPSTPATPLEQGNNTGPATPATPQHYWIYCETPNIYYPYNRDCPTGWKATSITPSTTAK